jgi:hypothetical protein
MRRVNAIYAIHCNEHRQQRRLWYTFKGKTPTQQELEPEWPESVNPFTVRILKDNTESEICDDYSTWHEDGTGNKYYRVLEREDIEGRMFWREIIPQDERIAGEKMLLEWYLETRLPMDLRMIIKWFPAGDGPGPMFL